MRVTWLSVSDALGGSEVALVDMINALRSARPGWVFQVVLPGDGPLGARARAAGATCTVVRLPPALATIGESAAVQEGWSGLATAALGVRLCAGAVAAPGYERRLRDAVSGFGPDIIHTNGLKAHVFGARLQLPGSAVLWHVHEYLAPRRLTRLLMRRYSARCSGVIANSASVAADVRAMLHGSPDVHVVHNAVDLEAFAPSGARLDLDAVSGLSTAPAGVVRVGLLATFARWKGHDVFLRALGRVAATSTSVRGYVIGGALYDTAGSQYTRPELEGLVESLGLRGRVGFTGFVDAASALRALDVVVHASTEPEPFGLAVAEAMACGRAVITTAYGGVGEIIEPGVDAVVAPPGDVEALAAAIMSLIDDPARRATLGSRARAAAAVRFSRQRMAEDLGRIYEAVAPARLETISA
jgi:glycosyltransferase involved in cell wall biosynthesis